VVARVHSFSYLASEIFPGCGFFGPWPVDLPAGKKIWIGRVMGFVWLLLQEGGGSFSFGPSLLWYGGLVGFYLIFQIFFEPENIFFVVILSAFLGMWHFAVANIMALLQDVVLSQWTLLRESAAMFILFPVAWRLTHGLYRKWVPRDPT
jgi:hypothetical protein